jgi:ferredoxin-NADP reductase
MEFTFSVGDSGYTFVPGQNADFFNLHQPTMDAEGTKRAFSFSSPLRADGTFTVTMRMRETAFKQWWRDMPLGTKVRVTDAMGEMILPVDTAQPVVLLAGGIGVTPFHAMIEHIVTFKTGHRATLLYSNRHLADAAYHDSLMRWSAENENITYVPTLTDAPPADWTGERGYITAEMIRRHVHDIPTALFCLAGPQAMTKAMRSLLTELGVPPTNMRQEEFSGY